jgi:hypothetical protein
MKLYTEEQVKKAIEIAQKCDHDCGGVYFDYGTTDGILQQLKPIELPSDEEIKELSCKYTFDTFGEVDEYSRDAFEDGIKWMRDKIQGGNNER